LSSLPGIPEDMGMNHKTRALLSSLQDRKIYNLEISCCGSEITRIRTAEQAAGLSASNNGSGGPASGSPVCALAVDIGTTTVVAYLLDLETGERIGSASALNSQKAYGADVISRIEYIGENPERLKELQTRIVVQIEELCFRVLNETGRSEEDLLGIFAAGNTTMMHFLQGLSPRSLAEAPFLPVSTVTMILTPGEINSNLPDWMRFILLPSLSAYIGADIIAGILSTEMAETDELCLLVDIGTNGEIALGNRDKMTSCSTAAGPAFEGANIRCGSAGVPGAVSAVSGKGSSISWETIGGKQMTGICGSGIIDLTAYLLKSGLADYTGRLQDESDWGDSPAEGAEFLMEVDGELRFVWTDGVKELYFSQKDLREVQLAKGSIAAGISTLIKESGSTMDDIKHVYLAGGFGSYINTDSALAVGLLPEELRGKIRSVGNSCGGGVIRCALSREEMEKCERIKKNCGYVELSSHPGFQEEYMMSMYFPETVT
ncbi:MAG: ASKHA domain-containing protein, partial [Spirochaetales bacterium]|nr:ASKHA domain-containing protein [Spirochaetales bacterium]